MTIRQTRTEEPSMQKFAGGAAFLVGVTSILYGFVFFFLLPTEQKNAGPAGLVSFAQNPVPRLLTTIILALGGLAASAAVVGIYQKLRERGGGWALWSLTLGSAYSLLGALTALYTFFLVLGMSRIYARGDQVMQAAAVVVASMPSPVDPYDFTKLVLTGCWLFVTGLLMVRSQYFPRLLGYLAFIAGFGVLELFFSTIGERPPRSPLTETLILLTAAPGAVVIAPVFWLWTGLTLWTKK